MCYTNRRNIRIHMGLYVHDIQFLGDINILALNGNYVPS